MFTDGRGVISLPVLKLSSGLHEQGSEVRAMSHAGSFSSLLETSDPEKMEDET